MNSDGPLKSHFSTHTHTHTHNQPTDRAYMHETGMGRPSAEIKIVRYPFARYPLGLLEISSRLSWNSRVLMIMKLTILAIIIIIMIIMILVIIIITIIIIIIIVNVIV